MTKSILRRVAPILTFAFSLVTVAYSATPSPPPSVCIDGVCVSGPASSSNSIKFHPGHYVWIAPNLYTSDPATLTSILDFIDTLADEPAVAGVQIEGYWSQFEGATAGDYTRGFATMDAILARCAKYGKRVMLGVWTAAFSSSLGGKFPDYIVNGTGYGVSPFNVNPDGWQTRIWQSATSDRLIALFAAYGAKYNSNPYFEMMTLGETSVNLLEGTDGYTYTAFDTQLRRQMVGARAAFPNTAVRLGANFYGRNYPDTTDMNSLLAQAVTLSMAVGGPDTLPNSPIQSNESFTGHNGYNGTVNAVDYRGVVPFVSEVQDPELGSSAGTWTNAQLYTAAMEGRSTDSGGATGAGSAKFLAVRPQYFVWNRNEWSGGSEQKWTTGILPFIRSINGAVSSKSCPAGYKTGCITN